jgi:hydrophobic/amphiphilic exporter-1 (mainly G- bacteria), HAE1 family
LESLYRKPLSVYILLGFLAIIGIFSGAKLPISLFPNSSQPEISISVDYGDFSREEFKTMIGSQLEGQIKGALIDGFRVDQLTTEYRDRGIKIRALFEWGTDGQKALRELESISTAQSGAWPEEIRKSLRVQFWNENGGFLAISFFSSKRSLDEIYDVLDPLLTPLLTSIPDASEAGLWNPQQKSIEIELDPDRLAAYQILTSDVEASIVASNSGYTGGTLTVGDGNKMNIILPNKIKKPVDLGFIIVKSRNGNSIQLKDIAKIRMTVDKKSVQSFKTNGMESLILFADPKPGGNIKRMADDVMSVVEKVTPNLPKDIEYKILVNPSQFINSSVKGVIHEVGLAALLAVIILFIFIGSLKNVITAAIEIPLSIVMAFILMKLFHMNLNLISLGGLALSAGMNVDASVVVMENIFRHFATVTKKLNFEERLQIVVRAVNEVKAPIISSTIASLVVFIPLIATNGLTNSILGDLAKAVVFSHSLSAVVALILVPTIRLQLMKSEGNLHPVSPIEGPFRWLEDKYILALEFFMSRNWLKITSYCGVATALFVLSLVVIPKLPKEIIGKPETDWIMLILQPQNFTEPQQLISLAEKVEFDVLKKYEPFMLYTFTQLRGANFGNIMIRLKSKSKMNEVWKKLEEDYSNTPDVSYFVAPWNPSELKIPDPPHLRVEVQGGSGEDRALVSQEIQNLLQEEKIFPRVNQIPSFSGKDRTILINPYLETLGEIGKAGTSVTLGDLGHYLRVATDGKRIGDVGDQIKTYPVNLRIADNRVKSLADLKGLPIGINGKILPISALAQIETQEKPPTYYRINQANINLVFASENESEKAHVKNDQQKAAHTLEKWQKENQERLIKKQISVSNVDPNVELNQAIEQLKWAMILSVTLVFLTIVLQFGDVVHSLIVLIAIPLGVIGVLLSLWLFKSTLSLNSVLGVILLNGISVANSIILVDFMKRLVDEGMPARIAAVAAARARLRPILMTSLATVLGMLPIALGMGEGGKILQPLGIAVSGGLWISMLLTIFLVPTLQVTYLEYKKSKQTAKAVDNLRWQNQEPELR